MFTSAINRSPFIAGADEAQTHAGTLAGRLRQESLHRLSSFIAHLQQNCSFTPHVHELIGRLHEMQSAVEKGQQPLETLPAINRQIEAVVTAHETMRLLAWQRECIDYQANQLLGQLTSLNVLPTQQHVHDQPVDLTSDLTEQMQFFKHYKAAVDLAAQLADSPYCSLLKQVVDEADELAKGFHPESYLLAYTLDSLSIDTEDALSIELNKAERSNRGTASQQPFSSQASRAVLQHLSEESHCRQQASPFSENLSGYTLDDLSRAFTHASLFRRDDFRNLAQEAVASSHAHRDVELPRRPALDLIGADLTFFKKLTRGLSTSRRLLAEPPNRHQDDLVLPQRLLTQTINRLYDVKQITDALFFKQHDEAAVFLSPPELARFIPLFDHLSTCIRLDWLLDYPPKVTVAQETALAQFISGNRRARCEAGPPDDSSAATPYTALWAKALKHIEAAEGNSSLAYMRLWAFYEPIKRIEQRIEQRFRPAEALCRELGLQWATGRPHYLVDSLTDDGNKAALVAERMFKNWQKVADPEKQSAMIGKLLEPSGKYKKSLRSLLNHPDNFFVSPGLQKPENLYSLQNSLRIFVEKVQAHRQKAQTERQNFLQIEKQVKETEKAISENHSAADYETGRIHEQNLTGLDAQTARALSLKHYEKAAQKNSDNPLAKCKLAFDVWENIQDKNYQESQLQNVFTQSSQPVKSLL